MSHRPIALLAALMLAGLLVREAWPPDEMRTADLARAMAAGESWLVPRLDGRLYREKPPVFFWMAAGLGRLGVPAQAAPRAAAGLAALATLLMLPGIASALGLPRSSATRAGWLLAATPLFLIYAQIGMLDSTASACVSAAIAAKLARARRVGGARAWLVVLEGAALAAALLTKGPVLLLFPIGLRVGAALARERSAASADASDAAAAGVALGLAGAWLLAATRDAGLDYARSITLGQAVRRMSGLAPHLRPPGYLLGVTLLGLLPWTLLGVPLGRLRAAWRSRTSARPASGVAALLGWIALPALFLSLLRTQQPHYLLPALPAFALLLAPATDRPERWATRCAGALALLAGGALLLRAATGRVFTSSAAEAALAGDAGMRVAAGLAGALLLALLLPPATRLAPWVRAAAGVTVVALFTLFAFSRVDPWMAPRALLASETVERAERLAATESMRSTVRVLTGRAPVEKVRPATLAGWLSAGPGRVALVWKDDLERLGDEGRAIEAAAEGSVRGRALLAVRAAPTAAAQSDRIR